MPGDNAAPPTQPRTESIVCTSLVLLSSPVLPRRGAQGNGNEEPRSAVVDNGDRQREIRDLALVKRIFLNLRAACSDDLDDVIDNVLSECFIARLHEL